MADIELVIRINKEVVEAFDKAKKENALNYYMNVYKDDLYNAIKNGTPLPKGHGRIADIDRILEEMKATRTYDIPFAIERVKPIIEADTESEE